MKREQRLYEVDEDGPVYTDENGVVRWCYGNKPVDAPDKPEQGDLKPSE